MKKTLFAIFLLFAAMACSAQTSDSVSKVVPLIARVIIQPEIGVGIIGFEITSTTDNPVTKTVTSNVNLITRTGQKYDRSGIVVWQGQAYDDAGQWTDEQLRNRLIEILK